MKSGAKNLVIRVDAGPQIGMGHYVRCLALAQHWCFQGGRVFILTNIADKRIGEMPGVIFQKTAERAANAGQLIEIIREKDASWVLIDGHNFDPAFLEKVGKTEARVLFLDDDATLKKYPVDILLNQNIFATSAMYKGKTQARLLLGNYYALLRPKFLNKSTWSRKHPSVATKLLVTFGGADPLHLSQNFLEIYSQLAPEDILRKMSIRLIVGQMNSNFQVIKDLSKKLPNCRVLRGVTNMQDHMRWSDIALSSGGSTVWELSFYETPMLLMPVSVPEEKIGEHMVASKAAIMIKTSKKVNFQNVFIKLSAMIKDKKHRSSLGIKAGALVDGNGALRVIHAMQSFKNLSIDQK